MAINGQIVDEINGLIASRDSIRTTMVGAGVTGVTNSSKLADLAVNLANAKLPTTTYNVSDSNKTIIPAGKLTTGAQIIRGVTTSGIETGNIKYGTTILVGDSDSAGRIKNVTGTFTKEDNNPITAAMVLSGKVGYVNGTKVTGNIPTVTPSATKLDCGKSASISKGYLASDVTITANSLASQTPGNAAAGYILSGKTAWVDGKQVTGNIATVTPSATSLNCGDSATIDKGYLASAVTITANSLASQTSGTAAAGDILSGKTAWVGGKQLTGSMPNATITSGSATISSAKYTYNSSNGNFGVTGSATIAAPSVGTAGYISSSEGTRNGGTASLSATVAKIAGSTAISGTTTKQPSISRQSISISNVTDAAAGNAQTSAPTSGVWVKVKSDANTGTLTATPSVSTEGYGTGSYHGIGGATATVGAAASADTYVPIKTGGVSVADLGTLTKQPSISRQSISISNVTDAAAGNAQTSAPTSGVWVKVKSAANTASYTPSATKTEGWVSGGSVSGTAGTYGAAASADTYVPIKTGDYSASVVSITAGSASMSATGVSTKSTSNCYITLSTSAGSATGKATIGTAGWITAGSKSSSASVSVSGNGNRLYLATYTPSAITVTNQLQTLTTGGKVCTEDITIPAVNYYYTSLDTPTNSQGNNGDVWLVVDP